MNLNGRTRTVSRSARRVLSQAPVWRTELGLGLVTAVAAWWLMHQAGALPAGTLPHMIAAFLLLAVLVLHQSPPAFLRLGPGPANRVTFLRAALVLPLAVAAVHPVTADAGLYGLIGLAATALAMDGLDGAVARRSGRVTAFGARFDMELDAFLILVLSVLVWRSGQAGAWVLLIGLMRYAFVAAGWRWRWLDGPLPSSRRRQALCVVQSVALLAALAPVLTPASASAIAGAALLLLTYSFAVDVLWLHRNRHPAAGDSS